MLLTLLVVATAHLVLSCLLLVALGHRVRASSRLGGLATVAAVAIGAGEASAWLWRLPAGYVAVAEAVLLVAGAVAVATCRRWNPLGQLALSSLVVAGAAYLAFTGQVTFAGGLPPVGMAGSAALWLLELAAIAVTVVFTFEALDVVCRVVWRHRDRPRDPRYRPFVSIHVPAYNEPPDLLIDTIRSLEGLDYDDFEIVVVDNNTRDPAVWQPVQRYCEGRDRVRFVHVDPWPGYKSGALNLALREHTDPRAELVALVDADYQVDPRWLTETVGYFADPRLAFVQSPQDYREYDDDTYLTACYDAYKYFFAVSMPSRNERDAIIFGGTMGLVRRRALEEVGGWDEWCITEDAELSLRLLRAGYQGHYVAESYGHGIMPLTFGALKRQRFRWAFGGIQILRKHWRALLPWTRDPADHLRPSQRLHYLIGGLQWFTDLVGLGFTSLLLVVGALQLTRGAVPLRPLMGAAVLLPAALIGTGTLRGLWALRAATGIGWRRSVLAFANWLSLSWVVALACAQGVWRREGVFLRTPKWKGQKGVLEAVRATRAESALAGLLWASGALAVTAGGAPSFLGALFAWQGAVYASAPLMAWLNLRSELSPQLELRRGWERLRDRVGVTSPALAGGSVAVLSLAVFALLTVTPAGGPTGDDLFELPRRQRGESGPVAGLWNRLGNQPVVAREAATPGPQPTVTGGGSGAGTPTGVSATTPVTPATATATPPAATAPTAPAAAVTTTPTPPASTAPSDAAPSSAAPTATPSGATTPDPGQQPTSAPSGTTPSEPSSPAPTSPSPGGGASAAPSEPPSDRPSGAPTGR